ncbi:MAG: hypothetical protein R3Y28_08300 [Candidatus Gastranaerophilales bacterium]
MFNQIKIKLLSVTNNTQNKITNPISSKLPETPCDSFEPNKYDAPPKIKSILDIKTSEKGKVRNEEELDNYDVFRLIRSQQKKISAQTIENFINKYPKNERNLVLKVLAKSTQFSNINSLSSLSLELNKYKDKCLLKPKEANLSLTNSLLYLAKSKRTNPLDLATNSKVGILVLDNAMLETLENSDEFLNNIKKCQEAITFVTPEGFNEGITPFNQTNNLLKRIEPIIDDVKKEMRLNPKSSEEKAITSALNKKTKMRLKKLGIDKEITIIKNPNANLNKPTTQIIAHQINGDELDFNDLDNTINNFKKEYRPYVRESLVNGMSINTSRSMGIKLEDLHKKILEKNNNTLDDTYFFLPEENKSYQTVALQYSTVNNVPLSKFLTRNQIIEQKPYCNIVILDDFAGSGISMEADYIDIEYLKNIHKTTLAPMICTNYAYEYLDAFNSDDKTDLKIVTSEFIDSFKNSNYFKSLDNEDQSIFKKLRQQEGYLSVGTNVILPYMAPDSNNELFTAHFSKLFTNCNKYAGIYNRAKWNHFLE